MPNSLSERNPPHHSINPAVKPASRAKRILVPLGIIGLGLAVLAMFAVNAPKPHKKAIVTKAPMVDVVEVVRGDVAFEIQSQGSIVPRTETTLVSEVSGVIKDVSTKFVVGGYFKQGELLLKIDPINYEVALLQAQARLEGAEAKLVEENARGAQAEKEWSLTGRERSNAPILALRKPQMQQAEADVKAAQADLRSAQIKLERTKIVAPYDAMLKAKLVDVGQYVSTGSQLATTFAVDYAEIRLPIKEHDFAYIKVPPMGSTNQPGARVELTSFQSGSMKTWQTHITRSEGIVDANSRVSFVVAQIDDPYGLLTNSKNETALTRSTIPMGTFVKATIFGEVIANVVTIPRKAIRNAQDIYLVGDDRKLRIAQINILRSDENNVYAIEGLANGDQVVVTKLATAVDGMTVRLAGDKSETLTELSDVDSTLAGKAEDSDVSRKEIEQAENQGSKLEGGKAATEVTNSEMTSSEVTSSEVTRDESNVTEKREF